MGLTFGPSRGYRGTEVRIDGKYVGMIEVFLDEDDMQTRRGYVYVPDDPDDRRLPDMGDIPWAKLWQLKQVLKSSHACVGIDPHAERLTLEEMGLWK